MAAPDAEMAQLEAAADAGKGPLRRCIATRAVLPKTALLRFVVGPDDTLVADVDGHLPGRGLWLQARADVLHKALRMNSFARAARRNIRVSDGLIDTVSEQLVRRGINTIGLAKRAGDLVFGFDRVTTRLNETPVAVLIAGYDGAADGRDKLRRKLGDAPVVTAFSCRELGRALGRERVVHAVIAPGALAERFLTDAERLMGFRVPSALAPPTTTT